MKKNLSILLLMLVFSTLQVFSQGSISGTIVDGETGETLLGATVQLVSDLNIATTADLDGNFSLQNVPAGEQAIVIRYVSYQPKEVGGIQVIDGKNTEVNVSMATVSTELGVVVIKTTVEKETDVFVTMRQKNSIGTQDIVSRQFIRRTPASNTGDVLKRLPGTTIQDNKFAIVRGLSDRYNNAMINGMMLPTTEPDRKTFAFDLYPSSLLDYLSIVKTASPDLPGEFAGGIIQMATRDIPTENYLEVTLGTGIETNSTFRDFSYYEGSGTDWLGYDDGTRAIPSSMPDDPAEYNGLSAAEKGAITADFPSLWEVFETSAPLDRSMRLTGGFKLDLSKEESDKTTEFGGRMGLNYSQKNRITDNNEINYFGVSGDTIFDFDDTRFTEATTVGAFANFGVTLNSAHKIYFRNDFNTNGNDTYLFRDGRNDNDGLDIRRRYYEYVSRNIWTTSLAGEHEFGSNIKFDWVGGYTKTQRDQPDTRIARYAFREDDSIYIAGVSQVPSFSNWGHFFSDLSETSYQFATNLQIPFTLGQREQFVKVGGYYQHKDREFQANIFGYTTDQGFPFTIELLSQNPEDLLSEENFGDEGLFLTNQTNATDRYFGASDLTAGYVMLNNKIGDKLKLVWGIRVENWDLSVTTAEESGSEAKLVEIDTSVLSLLPSVNLTYELTDKINIRVAGSKTLARPEFRELANFNYYDFQTFTDKIGNPALKPTDIYNADIRLEYFPGGGQLISVSGFYKYFQNPISIARSGAGGGSGSAETPINEEKARNFGLETELRKNFDFINLKSVSLNANLAWINSKSTLSDTLLIAQFGAAERELLYQSPWLVNLGLTWREQDKGRYEASILYNVIGSRRVTLGNQSFPDIVEASRPLLDVVLSARVMENFRIKLTCSDLLASPVILYQDLGGGTFTVDEDPNNRYDEGLDRLISLRQGGRRFALSLNWTLK